MTTLNLDSSELHVLQTIANLRHEFGFPCDFNSKIIERSGLQKKEFRAILNGIEERILATNINANIDWSQVF